ncbi:MAG: HNH endonuclease [SAR324 cluster bacterium]|nr:HNH endonuclease [SAR324 cluster bacterium]
MYLMKNYIPEDLRRLVASRSGFRCEYCLIEESDTFLGCEVDHIISLKHGGITEADNLAYACTFCNRKKGSDIGSILWETGAFIRFFNPRKDRWEDHFRWEGFRIIPQSEIGEVTEQIIGFNHLDRILERKFGTFQKAIKVANSL